MQAPICKMVPALSVAAWQVHCDTDESVLWRFPLEEKQMMVLKCQILNTLFSRNYYRVTIRT